MKNYFKVITSMFLLMLFVYGDVSAQKKKVVKKPAAMKFTEKSFGSPASITDITDVSDSSISYNSVKDLVQDGVVISYEDNTFKGKEPLRRGDFIVALNSALVYVKKSIDAGNLDTSLINTYDKNASYITNVSELKDLNANSIYYPATQSLIEKWGIAAPFTKEKLLNPGGTVSEKEVYDILHVTLGYTAAGLNPYTSAMNRNKFAIVLNNAVSQKMAQVNSLVADHQMKADADRRMQMDSLQQLETMRKDSVAKEIELRKMEADKQEVEARQKLAQKKKK